MTAPARHPDTHLDDWLDGRLEAAAALKVESHVASCERCRRLADTLRASRAVLRRELADEPMPPGLRSRILTALDSEDEAVGGGGGEVPVPIASRRILSWWPIAASLAAAVVIAVLWFARGELPAPAPGEELLGAIHASSVSVQRAPLPEGLAAGDAATVQERWAEASLGFPARVLDLSAMGIDLVGGDSTMVAGVRAARTVYRDDDELLICWMLALSIRDLPPAGEVRRHGGFDFHVYRREGETLVFWQEGSVLCGLVGSGDPEGVIALAFAKAMAPVA